MLTLIGKVDRTSYIKHDSISISLVGGDPASKATFTVADPGASLSITPLQEVIIIDEAATLGGATLVPTHNYIYSGEFYSGSGGWSEAGTLTGRIAYPTPGLAGSVATLTFSNQAVGSALGGQTVTNTGVSATNLTIPGQTYCLSGYVNVTSAFTNAYAILQLKFLDATGSTLATTQTAHITTTSGSQRFSLQATAPANAVAFQAAFGGATTNTTNSGTATFANIQCEPVWFPALYSYPTPICDSLQPDCVPVPFHTRSRFDRVFTGYISHLTVSYEGNTRLWSVEATSDDGWLENITLYSGSFASTTDASIITGITNGLPTTPLYTYAITDITSNPLQLSFRNAPIVYAGATINSIEYADATLREVLNSLADITGFLFGVDAYNTVYYYPPFYNAAPYSFSSSPDNVTTFGYYDYSIEYDASQIQNALNISGGTYEITVTENFVAGDGTHSQYIISGQTAGFYLSFAPAGTQSVPSISFGGTAQTITANTGAGYGSSHLLFDQPNHIGIASPLVNAGTSISATYTYDALVYVQAQSPDSIAQYGMALYSKINDNNLASNASAAIRGEAQLQAYAQPRTTLKFKTTKMLSPGQVIEFTSALDGLTKAHYTVQKVTATYLGAGINQYEVEAGTYVDDFVDFFRNSQKAINRANHNPAAPFQQLNNLQMDSVSYTDSLNIHL